MFCVPFTQSLGNSTIGYILWAGLYSPHFVPSCVIMIVAFGCFSILVFPNVPATVGLLADYRHLRSSKSLYIIPVLFKILQALAQLQADVLFLPNSA